MKNQFSTLISVFIVLILSSCDRSNSVYYVITNNSRENILINFEAKKSFGGDFRPDSLLIKAGQMDTLLSFEQTSPRVYNPELEDMIKNLNNINICRQTDFLPLTKDISLRDNWTFKATGRNSAVLRFTVQNNDFLIDLKK